MIYKRWWEKVTDTCDRMMVHGGWLVRSWEILPMMNANGICFLPDQNHEWELEEIKTVDEDF